MDAIRATYANCIKPVNSKEYWTPTEAPRPMPPTIKRVAHRSKLKRRADPVEKELSTMKVKKIFIVTCSKCGQKGHYYKTCTNVPQDLNWKPMTRKERRAQKKTTNQNSSTTQATNTNQAQEGSSNTQVNDNPTDGGSISDVVTKAKKSKNKLPKLSTRPETAAQAQSEEISLSQSAPQVEEVTTYNSNNNPITFREKQQIVRPTTPYYVPPLIPTPGLTLWFKSQSSQSQQPGPHNSQNQCTRPVVGTTTPRTTGSIISAETMAAASSTTASRLLKFVSTPGFRPPSLRPPKKL